MLQRQASQRHGLRPWIRDDLPHWFTGVFVAIAVLYALITVLVLVGSPLNTLDDWWYGLALVPKSSPWHLPVNLWVLLGQRGPAMMIVGVYVINRILKTRSSGPAIMYLIGSALFVATVAIMKYGTGRIGPRYTSNAHTAFAGGIIFPSGHVTGTVVIYGVAAMMAPRVHRALMTTVAVVLSVTIGFGTIALNTHWFSDVVGAWFDGALVLMVVWAILPEAHRRCVALYQRLRVGRILPLRDHGHVRVGEREVEHGEILRDS